MPRTIAEAESSSAIFRERNTIGTIAYSSVFNGCRRTVGTDRRKPRIFIASRTSPNSRMIVGAKRSMTTRTSIALAGIGSFRRLAVSLPEGIRKSRYAGIAEMEMICCILSPNIGQQRLPNRLYNSRSPAYIAQNNRESRVARK